MYLVLDHGGMIVIESIVSAINRHANSLLFIEISLLVLLAVLFIGTWIYNKKKYQNLKHQIPADVVKTYLDSIIHNSAALKSSLFRGGGDGIDASTIPSVLPLGELKGGDSVGVSTGSVSSAELNAKIAEIARLRADLDNKNNLLAELEIKYGNLQSDYEDALKRISELEKLLADAGNVGDDTVLKEQLNSTVKERDELREKLKEYGVIEDDLANLKRYRQENDLLRKALEEAGKPIPVFENASVAEVTEASDGAEVVDVAEVAAEPEAIEDPELPDTPVEVAEDASEEPAAIENQEVAQAVPDAPMDSSPDEDTSSPEDLLSEFEKMLG